MSFLLHLPSLFHSLQLRSDLIFFSVFRNIELGMKVRQKKTTHGRKIDKRTEREAKWMEEREKHTYAYKQHLLYD